MYKIFRGFHLVETYQELKKAKRLAEKRIVSRGIKLAVAIMVSLVLWFLPVETFGVAGLTIIEQRLISIFAFATLMWIFEAIPAWTTFRIDCCFIIAYRLGQQPMDLHTQHSC